MRTNRTVRRVAETVVAALRGPVSYETRRDLTTFRLEEWESSYHWLDANGLALYFRNIVRAAQLESCIPGKVLARFDRNYADNQSRLSCHLVEFQTVNQCLQRAGVRYVNLKGFTLAPDYCPDLSCRYLCDLDLMVRRAEKYSARVALETLGYRMTVEEDDTLEFRPREDRLPGISQLYKPRKQQAVEVHVASPIRKLDLPEDCLDRTVWDDRTGYRVPRLGEPDMFFSLVLHLYRHLLSEWVRLSWFYELGWCLQRRWADYGFWRTVLDRAEDHEQLARALALVLAFCKHAFSRSLPEPLAGLCSSNLSSSAQLWIDHYGPEMLFSDFPGNKLYLLLLREISTRRKDWQGFSRKRLLPFHAPARVLHGKSWTERIRHIPGNTRYGASRVRFHIFEGLRYFKEQWRWKRQIAQAALVDSGAK
jgi:hypothetical protein